MTQPPNLRPTRPTHANVPVVHPERWIVDAVRRAGHPVDERIHLEPTDSAWRVLTGLGFDTTLIARVVAAASSCKPAEFSELSTRLAFYMPAAVAERYDVVPVWNRDECLGVATANPLRMHLEEDLAFACGVKVEMLIASPSAIVSARSQVYAIGATTLDGGRRTGQIEEGSDLPAGMGRLGGEFASGEQDSGAGVASRELLDEILSDAVHERASDVHLEPVEGGGMIVRLRVDGTLHESRRIPEDTRAALVRRLKVACGIDIADARRPQDGRATFLFGTRSIDLRVSTLPLGSNVEKVTIRVLDSRGTSLELKELGFSPSELLWVERLMHLAEGLVLVTGPTGSGKTSTLYSVLKALRASEYNIMTVEDPVEYRLEGLTQVQVNPKAGMTFAAGLRTLMRQDPDIVLVGEIRDLETAEIAVRAGMTGHLVFSTLHTGDAASTVDRLLAIGIEPVTLSGTLKGVISQRLVRRLCTACATPLDVTTLPQHHQLLLCDHDTSKLRAPNGCPACRGTGYRGRMLIAEMLIAVPAIQKAIARRANEIELSQIAAESGMLTMWESGLSRVLDGTTSLFEMVDNVAPPMTAMPSEGQAEVDALVARLLSQSANAPAPAPEPVAPATPTPMWTPAVTPTPMWTPAITPTSIGSVSGAGNITAIHGASAGATPAARPARRVLVVDDDAGSRRELASTLIREGFSVVEASDGETALRYARRLSPTFVLTELALPKLDGLGLLQTLVQEQEPPRVVIYSRQNDPGLLEWAMELGAFDAMSRDVDVRVLCARLRGALESAA